MKRCIYIFSILSSGTMIQSFFKKSFEVDESFVPPKNGWIIPPACMASNWGRLKSGVVTDVKINGKLYRGQGVATETSDKDLRDCLIPDGCEEIFSPLE